jgi:hypothetical protein
MRWAEFSALLGGLIRQSASFSETDTRSQTPNRLECRDNHQQIHQPTQKLFYGDNEMASEIMNP